MNSSEHAENSEGETEKERLSLCRVKTESEDPIGSEESVSPRGRGMAVTTDGVAKRTVAQTAPEGHNGTRTREHLAERGGDHVARPRSSDPQEKPITSYRKPLYSISHRIIEKKATSVLDQHALHEPGSRLSYGGLLFPKLGGVGGEPGRRESIPAVSSTGAPLTDTDSALYPLIEKMFFILNTLNSSMTQLHSKVDLLSLEVTRIKRRIDPPSEQVAEFQPPPEYRLTAEELRQLAEQTSSAGELGCRLLVQLFPELFASEYSGNCNACGAASKRTPDSLHLQLVRNYVEVCFPLVRNGEAWQAECLPQINEFFSRFWAQKDMESSGGKRTASSTGLGLGLGVAAAKLVLDSDRLEVIRKYMEANFPDVPEDSWLQLCLQRMEEVLEAAPGNGQARVANGDGSETDIDIARGGGGDESYDSASLPDDVSVVKVGGSDFCDYDRPGLHRKAKKASSLLPVDFDKLEIPPPDFEVPREYLLTREQLRSNYECSLSIGNFASRLLVLMFPELFTYENTRKHYNCSGSLGKKQLDPVRVNLIRHYVQLLYPRAKNDRVWTLEFVGKLDERCRRRDTEQRRSYQQQRKVYAPDPEPELGDFAAAACQVGGQVVGTLAVDRFKDDFEIPPLPPEKSSKDFCKIPLEELTVSPPDFPVPSIYLLSDAEVREIVQQSLSVGNFAARLLVRLFPELFTQENLRLQYNHSGACNKKQLDPVRLRLIRHYVEAVYPVDKMEEVWHYECVPSIDERCRRPNRKKCDILKKAKRSSSASYL
ncbi:hypothetical protein JZ751_018945 [Albula glossodonta]|uniref:BEN domain-containing protein n=1 Tax=Albula glossodonta TaxID=121402 RepID=A0A8T2MV57_9TELE|nr:hypothetical protein JZ751_018945 [Albula glossodonta]